MRPAESAGEYPDWEKEVLRKLAKLREEGMVKLKLIKDEATRRRAFDHNFEGFRSILRSKKDKALDEMQAVFDLVCATKILPNQDRLKTVRELYLSAS